jgi:hypothetical protein
MSASSRFKDTRLIYYRFHIFLELSPPLLVQPTAPPCPLLLFSGSRLGLGEEGRHCHSVFSWLHKDSLFVGEVQGIDLVLLCFLNMRTHGSALPVEQLFLERKGERFGHRLQLFLHFQSAGMLFRGEVDWVRLLIEHQVLRTQFRVFLVARVPTNLFRQERSCDP